MHVVLPCDAFTHTSPLYSLLARCTVVVFFASRHKATITMKRRRMAFWHQKLRPGRPNKTNQNGQRHYVHCRLPTLWPGLLDHPTHRSKKEKRKEERDSERNWAR